MSKRILVVGCGQLGSRHLQSIATMDEIGSIDLVDTNEQSIELSKQRINEVEHRNGRIEYTYNSDLKGCAEKGDLCIIATQSKYREKIIYQVADMLGYKNFIVEKIVAQSVPSYKKILETADKFQLNIWVNCKTRAYGIHKYIKSKISKGEKIVYTDCGGNFGLGNNGIHSVDLFSFYTGTQSLRLLSADIENVLNPSKRGTDMFDLSGSLTGLSDNASLIFVSYLSNNSAPNLISVTTKSRRFIVDHFQKFAYESEDNTGWEWKPINIDENWAVSHMTRLFVADILRKGRCDLPDIKQSFISHEFILNNLTPYFSEIMGKKLENCPIT